MAFVKKNQDIWTESRLNAECRTVSQIAINHVHYVTRGHIIISPGFELVGIKAHSFRNQAPSRIIEWSGKSSFGAFY